jgi:hypothetical protein
MQAIDNIAGLIPPGSDSGCRVKVFAVGKNGPARWRTRDVAKDVKT